MTVTALSLQAKAREMSEIHLSFVAEIIIDGIPGHGVGNKDSACAALAKRIVVLDMIGAWPLMPGEMLAKLVRAYRAGKGPEGLVGGGAGVAGDVWL